MTDHSRLRAMLHARPWKPGEGDELTGTLRSRWSIENEYGTAAVLIVEDEHGVCWEWPAFSTSASRFVDEQNPQPGDGIGLRYEGEQTSQGGKQFHAWRGVVLRASAVLPGNSPMFDLGSGVDAPTPVGVESAVGSAPDRPTPPETPNGELVDPQNAKNKPTISDHSPDDDWHGPMCGTCQKPVRGKAKLHHGVKYHDECDPEASF
jgi:hypothetical protein